MAKQDDYLPERSEEQILAWTATVTVIGLIIGPLIGSMLYSFLGSMHTFFIYGSFLVFLSIVIKMNFNGDAEIDMDSSCDDSFRGDN